MNEQEKYMDEWTTKEELLEQLKIKENEGENILTELINKGDIDADYTNTNNPKFKLSKGFDIPRFLDGLDKKYGDLKDSKVTIEDDDKIYPRIRQGYLHLKHKLEQKHKFPSEVIELSKGIGYDLNKTSGGDLLTDAELFEIDAKTLWILKLTDNQIFQRNLPYERVVIDCDLDIDDLWFKGFLITPKGLTWTYWGDNDGYCDNPLIFDAFQVNQTDLEKHFQDNLKLKKSTIKKLKIFICNFFDFLNNPEVRVTRFERTKKNMERRLREGKEILPSCNKIFIRGQLKQYLDTVSSGLSTYNYRFWVRGHFKRFWNKKRYNKIYSMLEHNSLPPKYYVDDKIRLNDKIIMIWNKPFVKGSGVLISKRYEVKK